MNEYDDIPIEETTRNHPIILSWIRSVIVDGFYSTLYPKHTKGPYPVTQQELEYLKDLDKKLKAANSEAELFKIANEYKIIIDQETLGFARRQAQTQIFNKLIQKDNE